MNQVLIADETFNFQPYDLHSDRPDGAAVAALRGFKPADYPVVMAVLPSGELESLRPDEPIRPLYADARFIVVPSDRLYRISIDGVFFEWMCRVISGAQLRKLGDIPRIKTLFLERVDRQDRELDDRDFVDLDASGVEVFRSRKRTYKLNVQGVVIEVQDDSIKVSDALTQAGFDPGQGWQIFLIVVGQPKRKVQVGEVIDLTARGIEKLRLSPDAVNNAEPPCGPRRDFALSPADEAHLNRLGLRWETVVEQGRRFVCICDYPLPGGYQVTRFLLGLELPPTFPQTAIYGFFCHPTLELTSSREIPNTSQRASFLGHNVIGWSRQRPAPQWNPAIDNISTHLMIVDACLAQEVGE